MLSAGAEKRRAISRLLVVAALAAAAAAIVLAATGGFTVRPYGIRISAHGALRPALLAAMLIGLAIRVLPPIRQAQLVARAGQLAYRALPVLATLAAAAVLAAAVAFGSRVAGGSDAYGYVSEAGLWLRGDLHVHQDFVAQVPWPNADWTFSPLGYRPADGHTLVPTYAPGVPLLMALLTIIFGACGPYWLNPISGALLVLLAYGLGVRVSGRVTGSIAALLVASSPTVLFMSMSPMSDVPAAAFWALALLLASSTGPAAPAAAGLASGIAIAVRPNLAPLALFPLLLTAWPLVRSAPRDAIRKAVVFALAGLPFVLFIAWVNYDLYGSPFESGYGKTLALFDPANAATNFRRYPQWLRETQGPVVFLFPLAVLIPREPGTRVPLVGVLLGFVVAVWGAYLWYEPFDAWWYLRFVLPAFPAIFVLAGDVLWRGTRKLGTRMRIVATLLFACLAAEHGITQARARDAFRIGDGERKYSDVGRYVAAQLPANAVALAMQHSGSIRHYSRHRTIRWDQLDGEWLDRAIDHLRASGFEPYFVLEEWELAPFRARFASQASLKVLDRAPRAVHSRRVYVYETGERAGERPTENIPATAGCK
jgi:hypothetical protein